MKLKNTLLPVLWAAGILALCPGASRAWYDETHLAIARAAGYPKWFNAAGADLTKLKAHDREAHNHYVNNPPGTRVTPEMVLKQAARYNRKDEAGHLYGAIIASVRDYLDNVREGKYGEYHLAFCAHYVGDLSQPLHNTRYNDFNRTHHRTIDGLINREVLENLDRIQIFPVSIDSEYDLARAIAHLANRSIELGYTLEAEDRLLTRDEAYLQISHSASLFKAILDYVDHPRRRHGAAQRQIRQTADAVMP